jgi:hypothetical protein
MALVHHAYVLDYDAFAAELKPVLVRALADDDPAELKAFVKKKRRQVNRGRADIKWKGLEPAKAVQMYGDLALTCYYDYSKGDFGLADEWLDFYEAMRALNAMYDVLLGSVIQAKGKAFNPKVFNPWKLGAYVQTATEVAENAFIMGDCLELALAKSRAILQAGLKVLKIPLAKKKGMFVDF